MIFVANRVTPTAIEQRYPDLISNIEALEHRRMRQRLVAADGRIPDELWYFLKPATVSDWTLVDDSELESEIFLTRLLAILRLIDGVTADFSYFSFGIFGREWPEVKEFLKANRQALNKNLRRRVVLKPPPLDAMGWWEEAVSAGWKEPVPRGQFLHRLFHNLCRVPESVDCDVEHIVIRSADDAEQTIHGPLKIAVIPTIQEMQLRSSFAELVPGPLRITMVPPSSFAVQIADNPEAPRDFACMLQNVEETLREVCEQGVHVVVFPELVIPDPVLERVQQVLLSIAKANRPTPFLVVAGTFARSDSRSGKIYNEAVILNGRGNELFRQRKMHAYTMHSYEQPKYGLHEMFEGKPRTEEMEIIPRRVVFCDSPVLGFRVTVLICEDFCQQSPGLEMINKMRSNLVLSPVMAGTLTGSGFFTSAETLAADPEAVVVVGNSRALPSRQTCAAQNACSLGIVGSPLYRPFPGGAQNVHLLTETDRAVLTTLNQYKPLCISNIA